MITVALYLKTGETLEVCLLLKTFQTGFFSHKTKKVSCACD